MLILGKGLPDIACLVRCQNMIFDSIFFGGQDGCEKGFVLFVQSVKNAVVYV